MDVRARFPRAAFRATARSATTWPASDCVTGISVNAAPRQPRGRAPRPRRAGGPGRGRELLRLGRDLHRRRVGFGDQPDRHARHGAERDARRAAPHHPVVQDGREPGGDRAHVRRGSPPNGGGWICQSVHARAARTRGVVYTPPPCWYSGTEQYPRSTSTTLSRSAVDPVVRLRTRRGSHRRRELDDGSQGLLQPGRHPGRPLRRIGLLAVVASRSIRSAFEARGDLAAGLFVGRGARARPRRSCRPTRWGAEPSEARTRTRARPEGRRRRPALTGACPRTGCPAVREGGPTSPASMRRGRSPQGRPRPRSEGPAGRGGRRRRARRRRDRGPRPRRTGAGGAEAPAAATLATSAAFT